MKPLTRKDALKIANKLGAKIENGAKHDKVNVVDRGKPVAKYGIMRASQEKDHRHIHRQLGVSRSEVRGLADCNISKEEYFSLRRSALGNGTNTTNR